MTILIILLIPFIGFLFNGIGFKKIPAKMVAPIGVGSAFLSFILSVYLFIEFQTKQEVEVVTLFNWIAVGDLSVSFSFQIDQLSLLMLLIVSGVGSLIHLYAAGYMKNDKGFARFFSFLNLFLFFKMLLVLGANYLVMFVGWEGVGLCSYLLIGFWNQNTANVDAAKKAFVINSIGSVGFIIGILLLFVEFGTVEFLSVFEQAKELPIGSVSLMFITFSLFIGVMGKSAQIPLFTWLPDASAGPIPVSALIHAVTMLTAGVYLILRSNILFILAPDTMEFVAWIGALTSILAATIALFQNDIRKVLAYSTVSQLGFVFMGLGVMAFTAGFFHVLTHAFFKTLLLLSAGGVIHAMGGEQDIRKMGGLGPKMKLTTISFLIGTLAISGIPPFSGFFSGNEILTHVFVHNKWMWGFGMISLFMTAFYMFRLFFVIFMGEFSGTKVREKAILRNHRSMMISILILAIFSTFAGALGFPKIFNLPHFLGSFLNPIFEGTNSIIPNFDQLTINHSAEWLLMSSTGLFALLALFLAFYIYTKRKLLPVSDGQISGIRKIIYDKFYLDEHFEKLFVKPVEKLAIVFVNVIDTRLIDGFLDSIKVGLNHLARWISRLQNGSIGFYLLIMCIALTFFLFIRLGPEILNFMIENINRIKGIV